jgi:hypothetical protein
MKKFLKWSTALLVLGVLAVGCIKNEPSNGIEAMRNAKATLLTAQAELVQAKAQLEKAKAQVEAAKVAIVQAEAERIEAEAALLKAEAAWQAALTNFKVEGWEIKIQEMEADLREKQAEVDAAIAKWELKIAELQADLVAAQQEYEDAMLAFELWKLNNIDTLAQALIEALDELTAQTNAVLFALARQEVRLNNAKAAYLVYIQATYPAAKEVQRQALENEQLRLLCEVEHLTAVAAAFEALYNNYHGEFDSLVADFQEEINALREEIAQLEIRHIAAWEERYILSLQSTIPAEEALTTVKRKVSFPGVFSDGGDDFVIHVTNGNYLVNQAWGMDNEGLVTTLSKDIRIIEDTRIGLSLVDIQAELTAKQKVANDAKTTYEKNWNDWQDNYKKVQPTSGALYVAWKNAYDAYVAANKARLAHIDKYGLMYARAEELIELYMNFLEGTLVMEDGKYKLPVDGVEISPVLGGITFEVSTLLKFVFGGEDEAQAFIDFINAMIGVINLPTQLDAIVTELKAIMDGTHPKGWDPFWDVALSPVPSFVNNKVPAFGDIMRQVYDKQGRDLTEITKQDWYVWMTLYWLFEARDVEIGLDGFGALITKGTYTDATEKVLHDFFGKLNKTAYTAVVTEPAIKPLNDAIDAYYKAVGALSTLEEAMFEPFNRLWRINAGINDWNDIAHAKDKKDPKDVKKIVSIPDTFQPDPYNQSAELDENPYANPQDENEFFFKLEAFADQPSPVPSLHLDDFTWLDAGCNLWVHYRALEGFVDNCGIQEYENWYSKLLLWKWADHKDAYAKGHYYFALVADHDYKAYLGLKNRIENGDYEALLEKLKEARTEHLALQKAAKAYYQAVLNGVAELTAEIQNIEATIAFNVGMIDFYNQLIAQAKNSHNGGTHAEGLLVLLNQAQIELLEAQGELNEITVQLELLDQDFASLAPLYQARINAILNRIANLQDQLTALEVMRATLLAEYGF